MRHIKTNTKMADINPPTLTITLNVNRLNALIERQ